MFLMESFILIILFVRFLRMDVLAEALTIGNTRLSTILVFICWNDIFEATILLEYCPSVVLLRNVWGKCISQVHTTTDLKFVQMMIYETLQGKMEECQISNHIDCVVLP